MEGAEPYLALLKGGERGSTHECGAGQGWLQGPAQPPGSAQGAGSEEKQSTLWWPLLALPVPALADGIHTEKESLRGIPASQHCEKQVQILVLNKLAMLSLSWHHCDG